MSKKYTITVQCDTADVLNVMKDFFLQFNRDLTQMVGQGLAQQNKKSDPTITVKDNVVYVNQKSGNKGNVVIPGRDDKGNVIIQNAVHSELPTESKYIEVRGGTVFTYVKTADNIDTPLARYTTINEALEDIDSDRINDLLKQVITAEADRAKAIEEKLQTDDLASMKITAADTDTVRINDILKGE